MPIALKSPDPGEPFCDRIIERSWGPERIETGWWRGDDVRRDYYLIETTTGECFWLFRTLPEERWFYQAEF